MAYRNFAFNSTHNTGCRLNIASVFIRQNNFGRGFHATKNGVARLNFTSGKLCYHTVLSKSKSATRPNFPLLLKNYCQKTENVAAAETYVEKLKRFWKGPTFKYWFIGVTAFSSWLAYYSLKSYKSTRVNVTLPLALPNHILVERKNDVSHILKAIGNCKSIGNKIKCVLISGPSGSGKSILSNFVATELMRQVDWNPIGLPKSHTSVFLHGDTLKGFLLSLQAFAASLKIKPMEIRKKMEELGSSSDKNDQCKAILDLIKERLEKHPHWVIVVDNLQQGSSEDVIAIINDVILSNDSASKWSKGTLLLTSDGIDPEKFHGISNLQMKPRYVLKSS